MFSCAKRNQKGANNMTLDYRKTFEIEIINEFQSAI
ncbi:antitoxin epsilon, partial [Enterococcus hirae]|nr:antitoxin epsilon [Enterococcus avium]